MSALPPPLHEQARELPRPRAINRFRVHGRSSNRPLFRSARSLGSPWPIGSTIRQHPGSTRDLFCAGSRDRFGPEWLSRPRPIANPNLIRSTPCLQASTLALASSWGSLLPRSTLAPGIRANLRLRKSMHPCHHQPLRTSCGFFQQGAWVAASFNSDLPIRQPILGGERSQEAS